MATEGAAQGADTNTRLVDALRAAVSYPFDPDKKASTKHRHEQAVKNVLKIASKLEAGEML